MRTYEAAEEEGDTPYDYEVQSRDLSFRFGFQETPPEPIEEFAEKLERILRPTPSSLSRRILQPPDGGTTPDTPTTEIDLAGLGQEGLLRVIASAVTAQTRSLFNIEDFLRPFTQITVSGTNAIENAGASQPVIPESDDIDIPTRTVFVRAAKENTAPIYIGDENVSGDDGLSLYKGEGQTFNVNVGQVVPYMVSPEDGQVVEVLGVI